MARSLVSMILVAGLLSACGPKDTGDSGSAEPLIKSTASAKPTATQATATAAETASPPPPTTSASTTPSASASASASGAPAASGHAPGGIPGIPADAQKKGQCIAACMQKNIAKGLAAASECQTECNK